MLASMVCAFSLSASWILASLGSSWMTASTPWSQWPTLRSWMGFFTWLGISLMALTSSFVSSPAIATSCHKPVPYPEAQIRY